MTAGRGAVPIGTPHRTMALILVVALVTGLFATSSPRVRAVGPAPAPFVIPSEDALGIAADAPVTDTPLTIADLPGLDQVSDEGRAAYDSMPEADWVIDALAQQLDYDPSRAFAFVRDSIGFDPFAGVLRGAAGTLAARAGNSVDRALLLAALLGAMQVPVRFAFAELDDAATRAPWPAPRSLPPPRCPIPACPSPPSSRHRSSRRVRGATTPGYERPLGTAWMVSVTPRTRPILPRRASTSGSSASSGPAGRTWTRACPLPRRATSCPQCPAPRQWCPMRYRT